MNWGKCVETVCIELDLLSQLTIGSQTVSLVIMHEFNREVLVQTSAAICHGDRCVLNEDYCVTVHYYNRKILYGHLALCNGLNAAPIH